MWLSVSVIVASPGNIQSVYGIYLNLPRVDGLMVVSEMQKRIVLYYCT